MKEKPPKRLRLVSKGQYVSALLDKGASHTLAFILCGSGCGFLIVLLRIIWLAEALRSDATLPVDTTSTIAWFGLLSVLSVGIIWYGIKIFKAAERIEPVAPITRHNTGDLPEVETLVRASNVPPSHPQEELLRAVRQPLDTPPEQLLRATQEASKDV